MSWDTRAKEFAIVVDIPNTRCKNLDDFKIMMSRVFGKYNALGYMYFACFHDKDTNKDHQPKALHYHIVLISKNRKRCSTIAYELQSLMGNDSINEKESSIPLECIQIDKVDNLPLAVQYLIHKNDKEKYQYSFTDIITNSYDNLSTLFSVEKASVSIDEYTLFNLVDKGYTLCEIMFKIGLGNFNTYKKIIEMLIHERNNKWNWEKLRLLYSDGVVSNETN